MGLFAFGMILASYFVLIGFIGPFRVAITNYQTTHGVSDYSGRPMPFATSS